MCAAVRNTAAFTSSSASTYLGATKFTDKLFALRSLSKSIVLRNPRKDSTRVTSFTQIVVTFIIIGRSRF